MKTNRKFIPYSTQSIDKGDINALTKVLYSDWITQGPRIREFEQRISSYCRAKYAVVVSSGTAALHIACLAAGIKPGDEVITSPITFAASANCVLYCGGRPVFADIQEDTANIDPAEIAKNITPKTKAIIPIHFAGHPCELRGIQKIAKINNLIVIEDAAHALGAEYKGEKIGSGKYSDMTILSFHPVKHITTGEGGAVLTNNKDIYEKLLLLRAHGITKDIHKCQNYEGPWYYEMQYLGFNYRITDFQCALGISQLRKLNKFIEKRRRIARIYRKNLSKIKEIELPTERNNAMSSWHLYPIRLKLKSKVAAKRKEIFNYLRGKNIGVQVHYIPVYLHPYYQKLGYKKGICPRAEDFYQREISIPLYQSMSDTKVKYIINSLVKAFR